MQNYPSREKICPIGKSPPLPRSWVVNLIVEIVAGMVLLYIYGRRIAIEVLQTVLLVAIFYIAIDAVVERVSVISGSMQPTIYEGDSVFVNRLVYEFGEPKRGDIVVFYYPPDPTQLPYVKRVLGLPGDHVEISDGQVYVNDQVLDEPYLTVTTNRGGNWDVPSDSLFVMGDNRNNSSDSRSWGYVPLDNLIGRAEMVYMPLKHWSWLHVSSAVASAGRRPSVPLSTETVMPAVYPIP